MPVQMQTIPKNSKNSNPGITITQAASKNNPIMKTKTPNFSLIHLIKRDKVKITAMWMQIMGIQSREFAIQNKALDNN